MITHGHARRGNRTTEYRTWYAMKARCLNPKNKQYADYGGRGITICDQWIASFNSFLADMGRRPAGMTLERLDNSQGYGPKNCVWASRKQQQRNRRNNRWLTHAGRTMCLTDWAEEMRVSSSMLTRRLKRGWSLERALTTF